ncbi:MAG: hypothetical protein ACLRFE_01985 [Clostridia bacterium]
MRKYTIPKPIYFTIVLLLLCLSFGSTYAYFSSHVEVSGTPILGKINLVWVDGITSNIIQQQYDDPDTAEINEAHTIPVSGQLTRGAYVPIQTRDYTGSSQNVRLEVSNLNANASAYCRISISAKYTPQNSETEYTCPEGHLTLAFDYDGEMMFLEDLGIWFYDNGYYYYGQVEQDDEGNPVKTLYELSPSSGLVVADHLYLSEDANPNILGASIRILITLEGVQSTYDAYKSVWGVNW